MFICVIIIVTVILLLLYFVWFLLVFCVHMYITLTIIVLFLPYSVKPWFLAGLRFCDLTCEFIFMLSHLILPYLVI